MDHRISWFERLRIEWVVWSLDQRLYDLPRRSRIEKRREVRANLITAAHIVEDNAPVIDGCAKAAVMEKRPVRCPISVKPDVGEPPEQRK